MRIDAECALHVLPERGVRARFSIHEIVPQAVATESEDLLRERSLDERRPGWVGASPELA